MKPVCAPTATSNIAPAPVAPLRRAPSVIARNRIAGQPGFVLHSYPYKETSLIIDLFSRDHGRVALIAKGAKRPHSALRGAARLRLGAAAGVRSVAGRVATCSTSVSGMRGQLAWRGRAYS